MTEIDELDWDVTPKRFSGVLKRAREYYAGNINVLKTVHIDSPIVKFTYDSVLKLLDDYGVLFDDSLRHLVIFMDTVSYSEFEASIWSACCIKPSGRFVHPNEFDRAAKVIDYKKNGVVVIMPYDRYHSSLIKVNGQPFLYTFYPIGVNVGTSYSYRQLGWT